MLFMAVIQFVMVGTVSKFIHIVIVAIVLNLSWYFNADVPLKVRIISIISKDYRKDRASELDKINNLTHFLSKLEHGHTEIISSILASHLVRIYPSDPSDWWLGWENKRIMVTV